MQKQRNSKGQFVPRQSFIKDEVSLTNDFKGLEINQYKPIKPFPYLQSVIAMIIVFGLIALAHYLGWIEFPKEGGF